MQTHVHVSTSVQLALWIFFTFTDQLWHLKNDVETWWISLRPASAQWVLLTRLPHKSLSCGQPQWFRGLRWMPCTCDVRVSNLAARSVSSTLFLSPKPLLSNPNRLTYPELWRSGVSSYTDRQHLQRAHHLQEQSDGMHFMANVDCGLQPELSPGR